MTGYLLDTHTFIWLVIEPERASRQVVAELEDAEGCLWLSPVSIWEIALLSKRKSFHLGSTLSHWVSSAVRRYSLQEAEVTWDVALEFDRIQLPHKDPADRLLVATARVYGLTLVTADQRLLDSKACSMLKAV